MTKGTACMFSRLCPIVTVVCFTFYFSELQIRLTLLGITFCMNTFTVCFFLSSLKPLAGRISGGLENIWSTACIFNPLFPIVLLSALHFSFWHTILVLNNIGHTFSRISSCSLVKSPPLLIWWHSTQAMSITWLFLGNKLKLKNLFLFRK